MGKGAKGDLKSLRKLWYKKLKDEGFRDIEISKFGNELEYGPLMGRTSSPYSNKREYNAGAYDTRAYEFYHGISTFLAHNPFYPGRASLMWHRWILELYAEGVSITLIISNVLLIRLNIQIVPWHALCIIANWAMWVKGPIVLIGCLL